MMDMTDHNRLADQMNSRAVMGHNQPPSIIDRAKEAMNELSLWLKSHPVITNPEEAKEAGGWQQRTMITLKEARSERDTQTSPLNAALKKIRDAYDLVREKSGSNRGGALQVAYDELKRRELDYIETERRRREAIAEAARQAAAEAERIAREAEAREREAIDDAKQGAEADVGGAIENANAAFKDFKKLDRAAQVAQRDANVRIPSVMGGKSIAPKRLRRLLIADVNAASLALLAMGLDDETKAVLVKRAKLFEEAYGELPPGVTEDWERSL